MSEREKLIQINKEIKDLREVLEVTLKNDAPNYFLWSAKMKTTGLTLAEAVKSGRPFKRPSWNNGYVEARESRMFHLMVKDIVSEDYEIQPLPPKQTWTREEVEGIKIGILREIVPGTHRHRQVVEEFEKAGL